LPQQFDLAELECVLEEVRQVLFLRPRLRFGYGNAEDLVDVSPDGVQQRRHN
jgi:hypothetical protein